MPDREKVIAEVAKQNGIRIGPEDPIFASVTAMQLGLEETLRDAEHRFKGIISEFEANVRTVERNAGKGCGYRFLKPFATLLLVLVLQQ